MGNSQAKSDPVKRAMNYILRRCRVATPSWTSLKWCALDLYATPEEIQPAFDDAVKRGLIEPDGEGGYRTIPQPVSHSRTYKD